MQVLIEALDHHLAAVVDRVDHQPDMPGLFAFDDNNEAILGVAPVVGGNPEEVGQAFHRHVTAAQLDHLGRRRQRADLSRLGLDRFDDIGERQHEALAGQPDDHPVKDGQRQRQHHGEAGALARDRGDVDAAAKGFDIRSHHVHADAAARNARHALRRRKARRTDELVDLLVGQHRVGSDNALFHRLGAHLCAVDTAAIVADPHEDACALLFGRQADRATRRLAGGAALVGTFDAMADGVADHVGQRVADLLDDALVDLGRFPRNLELDRLACGVGQIAQHARYARKRLADRLRPQRHHRMLDFARQARQLGQFNALLIGWRQPVGQDRTANNQLADQIEQHVELGKIDPNALRRRIARVPIGEASGACRRRCHAGTGGVRCSSRGRGGRCAVRRRGRSLDDLDQGIGCDKVEAFADGVTLEVAGYRHDPQEITVFGVDIVQARQCCGLDADNATADALDFADQQLGFGAIGQRGTRRLETEQPVALCRRRRRQVKQRLVEHLERPGDGAEAEFVGTVLDCSDDSDRDALGFEQAVERRHRRAIVGNVGPVPRGRDMIGQHVERPEHDPRHLGRGGDLPGADLIENILETVRESEQRGVAERTRPALDRVNSAKDVGNDLVRDIAAKHYRQALLGDVEALGALLEEHGLDFVEFGGHAHTRRMAAPSLTASNGLLIQPVAPTVRARNFLSSENSVDSTRIGVPRNR